MPLLPARPVEPPSTRPSFGERLQGALSEIFDHGFTNSTPLPIGPRTQMMVFPQELSTPAGITPDLQTHYPEAYALARNVEQFGREQVALFRLTLENHQRRPHLFRELCPTSTFRKSHRPYTSYPRTYS